MRRNKQHARNPPYQPSRSYGHLVITASLFWSEQKFSQLQWNPSLPAIRFIRSPCYYGQFILVRAKVQPVTVESRLTSYPVHTVTFLLRAVYSGPSKSSASYSGTPPYQLSRSYGHLVIMAQTKPQSVIFLFEKPLQYG